MVQEHRTFSTTKTSTKPQPRILIVEDDRSIARWLQIELELSGFAVETVFDGLSALAAIERFAPQVIVLDILLPGMDGERVLREVRQRGLTTPVMMLTARDSTSDKVRNLDSGADDYLTKPFDIEELLARLRVILRRDESDDEIRVGDLTVNVTTRQVNRGGERIEFTAREFDLLEFLARNARRVMSRAMILDRVWAETPEVDPNVIDVYISYLRKKTEMPGKPRLIHTVRRTGFTLREE